MKQVVSFAVFLLLFIAVGSRPVFAKIWINEFSSDNGTDWVEIYNDSDQDVVPLSTYQLKDNSSSGNTLTLSGILAPYGFVTYDWGASLNKSGDAIRLIDTVTNETVDTVIYGDVEGKMISAPSNGQYAARKTDGGGELALFTSSTKGETNGNATQAPTPTNSPTSTPKPTATPTKAPTSTKSPTTSATKTPTPPSLSPKKSSISYPTPTTDHNVPTAVLVAKTETSWPTIIPTSSPKEVKTLGVSSSSPSVVLVGLGILILFGSGAYGYYIYRKNH